MSIIVDADKSASENFLKLVAESNPLAEFMPGRVTLSEPSINPETEELEVEITAIEGQGYKDSVVVAYQRVDPVISSGTQNKGPVPIEVTDSQEDIRNKIIAHHKLIASEVIITGAGADGEFNIPVWAGDESDDFTYQITSKDESLVYADVEGPYTGLLCSVNPYHPLSDAILETDLGGFVRPS